MSDAECYICVYYVDCPMEGFADYCTMFTPSRLPDDPEEPQYD